MDFITADLKYLEALRIVDMDPVMKDIRISRYISQSTSVISRSGRNMA